MKGNHLKRRRDKKGVSGFKVSARNRDAIIDLQEAALNKEFDVLLGFMFGRIGRIDDETPFIVEWFVKTAGIEVWSVKEGEQRFETHVDKLTNYIRFWQASGESEKTSIRIKTRMEQLRLDGLYKGGALPYGYRTVPSGVKNRKGQELKKFEIDLEQYVIYWKVIEKTIHNGTGSYVIAHDLNSQGYKTANGGKFTCMAVKRMLSAPLPRGYTKEGVLSGNIFCSHCGGRITTTHHKDRYIRKDGSEHLGDVLKYCCYHKSRKLCECDGQTNYIAAKVDEAVCQIMRRMFANMAGAPEEEKYKDILKKQQAAHNASRRKLV